MSVTKYLALRGSVTWVESQQLVSMGTGFPKTHVSSPIQRINPYVFTIATGIS
jgi:hypothetical protein